MRDGGGNVRRGLERGVGGQERGGAHSKAGEEAAAACTNDSLVIPLVGNADARLNLAPLNIGVVARILSATEQIIIGTRSRFRETSLGGIRPAITRNYHSVVAVRTGSGNHGAGLRVDADRLARIVNGRIEDNHVPPQGAVRNNDRITETNIDGHLLAYFPGVLSERLI